MKELIKQIAENQVEEVKLLDLTFDDNTFQTLNSALQKNYTLKRLAFSRNFLPKVNQWETLFADREATSVFQTRCCS